MLTRTSICILLVAMAAPTGLAQKAGDRPIHGKAPGFLPRRVPVAERVDRGVVPKSLIEHFDGDVEVQSFTSALADDEASRSARATRLLQSPVGSALRPEQRGYYDIEAAKRRDEVKVVVNEEVGTDSSWLYLAGGALVLGLGMAWWIRRLL